MIFSQNLWKLNSNNTGYRTTLLILGFKVGVGQNFDGTLFIRYTGFQLRYLLRR